jgi:hypothetical protein
VVKRTAASHVRRLAAIARTPTASGWAAHSKVRALTALVELGEASPVGEHEPRELLEDVADAPPPGCAWRSGRLAAREALQRLEAPPDDEAAKVRRLFDDRPDDERVAEDEWFPPPAPRAWVELYSHETLRTRRRWFKDLAEAGEL